MPYNPLPIIITIVGIYMMIKIGGVLLRHPVRLLSDGIIALKDKENFRSFTLALAGTLGVGNIFGVSLGIIIGGSGSLLWLLVSTIFSSVLKYCEVVLACDRGKEGGIFHTVKKSLGRCTATVYAVTILILAFVMGGALQCHTIVKSTVEIFDTPPYIISFLLTLLVLFGTVWGANIVSKITEIVIPLSTIVYILITSAIIILNCDGLYAVACDIIASAFDFRAFGGGVFAFLVSAPFTEGYSRGMLSNEAGAGTSTMAHAQSGANPRAKGVLGVFEVVFDTSILCMLTGISILLVIPTPEVYSSAMSLCIDTVRGALGTRFLPPLLICVFFFAYSTVICWYSYIEITLKNLGKRSNGAILFFYLLAIFIGSMVDEGVLVYISDLALLALTIICSITIIKNSDRIKALSEQSD